MKVLFDEGVPRPLARTLVHHEVSTVPDMSWSGVKNGELLRLIEAAQFEVFLSGDQNLQTQQNLANCPFAILIMTAVNWPIVRPHVAKIAAAVDLAAAPDTLPLPTASQHSRLSRKRFPSIGPVPLSGTSIPPLAR